MRYRETSKEELDRMIEEATVDCYNEDEAFRAKWLDDVVEVMGIDDEESGFEGEVLAEIRTEDDEYTVSLDELESMPNDTENGKYFEMYKYWIRGFDPSKE